MTAIPHSLPDKPSVLGGRKKLCPFGALRPPGAPKKTPAENMSPAGVFLYLCYFA